MNTNTLPRYEDLVQETEESLRENALMVLLNQPPPANWIKKHPFAGTDYLPISKVEFLLTRLFGNWKVEIKNVMLIANSAVVTVRVHITNPVTGREEYQDGSGAAAIQTDSGAAATDWTKVKSAGVQMAVPIAESMAIKDAAEKWGKIFGKDLNRKDFVSYDGLLKQVAAGKEAEKLIDKITTTAHHVQMTATPQKANGVKTPIVDDLPF